MKDKPHILLSLSLVLLLLSLPDRVAGQKNIPVKDTIKQLTIDSVLVIDRSVIKRNNLYQFSPDQMKGVISVVGEKDMIRMISVLPGVSLGMEGGMGYFVRGGNSGNNSIELDRVPVYGTSHLLGLFSTFQPEIIGEMDFRTGGFHSSSGNFIASITNIASFKPSGELYRTTFSISPFIAGASVSGPIIKNKLSFIAAGRYALLKPEFLLAKKLFSDIKANFSPEIADGFVKLNYTPSNKHNISGMLYFSNDYFDFNYEKDQAIVFINWGNLLSSINWEWKINKKYKLMSDIYLSDYYSGQKQASSTLANYNGIQMKSSLRDLSFRTMLQYSNNNWLIDFGLQYKYQKIYPLSKNITLLGKTSTQIDDFSTPKTYSSFLNIRYLSDKFTVNFGLRADIYNNEKTYYTADIRFNSVYWLSAQYGLELNYDKLTQFHHILEGLPVSWSNDVIVPSDYKFCPETAHQLYFGGFLKESKFSLSGGLYFKKMYNIVSYNEPNNSIDKSYINISDAIIGTGTSYGAEIYAERTGEILQWKIAYTLSKTDRKFIEINDGKSFPFKFDRRHIINASLRGVTRNKKGRKHFADLSLVFYNGNRLTIPTAFYDGVTPPFWLDRYSMSSNVGLMENALYRQLMSGKNAFMVPNYFRCDLGYTFSRKRSKMYRELTIGIYNIFNRKNSYHIFYDQKEMKWKQISILPIIPSIRWSIEF